RKLLRTGASRPSTQQAPNPNIRPTKKARGVSKRRVSSSMPPCPCFSVVPDIPSASRWASKGQVNERLHRQAHAVERVVQNDADDYAGDQRQQTAPPFHGCA